MKIYTGVIYIITNRQNSKQYIGKTDCKSGDYDRAAHDRWRGHVSYARRIAKAEEDSESRRSSLASAIRKYGESSFSVAVLDHYDNENELAAAEIRYIAEHHTRAPHGYNLTAGGEGASGYRHTEEWKKRKSLSMKGSVRSDLTEAAARVNRGKKRPVEVVAKISAMHKGKQFLSNEGMKRLWEKARIAKTGRKDNQATKQRKKAAQRANGRMITFNGKTQCMTAWSEETGLPLQTIHNRVIRNWSPERVITTPRRRH